MKPEHLEQWKATRARGFWRYVLLQGVLAWGVPMFVAMTFVVNRRTQGAGLIALQAVIWLIAGAAFGTAMWFVTERNYRKATAKAQAPTP